MTRNRGGRSILRRMPHYSFAIRSADGRDREDTGTITLSNDDEARAFGEALIWDMRDAVRYADWIMSVADGERAVCDISFRPLGTNPRPAA